MTTPRELYAVVPAGIDDPAAPSGGNVYDRRVCQRLPEYGWSVRQLPVPGRWPQPAAADRDALAGTLAALPDGAVTLVDGLVGCPVPEVVTAESGRLRLAILVHLPLGDETGLSPAQAAELDARERRSLHAAAAVVATSHAAARRLIDRHGLAPQRVHVATPGVDPAPPAPGTDGASRLLCVAAVTHRKGQDLLVHALAALADRPWSCLCVGGWGQAPEYVDQVRRSAQAHGLAGRIQLAGPRTGAELSAAYAAADLLVLPSRAETYGMVVTEALARGIPVIAADVGGVPEALGGATDGGATDGGLPGMLVPPADLAALTDALRQWLDQPATRARLRQAAWARRAALPGWGDTAASLGRVLGTLRAPLEVL